VTTTIEEDDMTDEQQIRTLIEQWARAAQAGDIEVVLADHDPQIVMFDVPPPYQGVRGIDAYRDSWPQFFAAQANGGIFELESLEVIAGVDVAFAYGLLWCGTAADFAREPEQRLRLTVGLRKTGGRWVVTHEHHSFSDATPPPEADGGATHEGSSDGPR
jgi:ketosteroid isomerase-like protein